ncbi:MAG TPA: hypothetical protein VGB46_02790, partial [Flavisolibacter sp.]
MPQAIDTYQKLDFLSDSDGVLSLAWTSDEREFLSADLNAIIAGELESELRHGLEYINSYFVKDPYGEKMLKPAVSAFFSLEDQQYTLTCGAGIISLISCLAKLAVQKPACIVGDVYPDLPFWLEQSGAACHSVPAEGEEPLLRLLEQQPLSFIFLERPGLTGHPFQGLPQF